MPQEIASLFATIGADLTGLTSGLAAARGQLTGFQGHMASAGANMQRIGAGMAAAITVPLVGAGVAMVNEAAKFESAVNVLGVAARQSGTAMSDLSAAALAVGEDTQLIGIDAMQAADALTTFYKTGLTTADIFGDLNGYLAGTVGLGGALRASIDLAAASDLDLAAASDAVAIAMKTFNLTAADAVYIADSFVGSADASVAEVSDLVQALYVFGPTANQFGWSLAEANTALAILSERGIRGAEAGTALRSMMTNLMRDADPVTEALQALNISLYDQEGALFPLPKIIGDLSAAMAGLTEEQRNQYIQTLAGTYGMKALATFIAEGTDGFAAMTEQIGSAATAQEVGTQRTKGFAAALEQFGGTLQTFLVEAGIPFIEKFATPGVRKLSELVGRLADLSPENLERMLAVLGGVAAGGPILVGLGALTRTLALIPPPLLAIGAAAGVLGGAMALGSAQGQGFIDGLWKLDEVVYSLGGPDALQKWINIRQGLSQVSETLGVTSLAGNLENWTQSLAEWVGSEGVREEIQKAAAEIAEGLINGAASILGSDAAGQTAAGAFAQSLGRAVGNLGQTLDIVGASMAIGLLEGMKSSAGDNWFGRIIDAKIADQKRYLDDHLAQYGLTPEGGVTGAAGAQEIVSQGWGVTIYAKPGQTKEEVNALLQPVLPTPADLQREVFLGVRVDPGDLERSADQVAASWAAKVKAKLDQITRPILHSGPTFEEMLQTEASAYGVRP